MKIYTGTPGAARNYVEMSAGRADDYYLAEGVGVARRFTATPDLAAGSVVVQELSPLQGEGYQAWVAGVDPDTGQPRGRVRHDGRAVRFVEVTVNGPKSWSLAAELHPDIAAAYDAAQDRAAEQVIGWLAQHATTRVGPRGAQVSVPVEVVEAVTVRHYTSRAGDPHRHLHLQLNARVFAAGRWRGVDTVAVRDSIGAVNGIGHAAVMTDPGFRAALAAHGFTLDPEGEITQLADYVGGFSARAAQIARNIDGFEAAWRAINPEQEPGPGLRRAWDARAWAQDRPDKVTPQPGEEIHDRWLGELAALGYRDRDTPTVLAPTPVGQLDRDRAVETVLARLGARRSGWNRADVRGEVEQLIARGGVVADAAVRIELAEDLTARTIVQCVPLVDRSGVAEHVRTLTSRRVLQVEADLTGRLAIRAATPNTLAAVADTVGRAPDALDAGQVRAVTVLASGHALVVVEGAAGAGKTTTLAAARVALEAGGRRLVVVTPTLKAAQVAARQLGTTAGSAAWLAYQHGYRWDEDGRWSRLRRGDADPHGGVYAGPSAAARIGPGDLLLCDEAGMLDQDTARALVRIADEHGARLALMGDRHQLPAVGRGGVLDLAVRWAAPDAYTVLDELHRFVRTRPGPDGRVVTERDDEYATLSLAMRTADEPAAVFDALVARGQIRVHRSDVDRLAGIADSITNAAGAGVGAGLGAGVESLVVADTREQVALLNAAVRDRLITLGIVSDHPSATTMGGERIGVGDQVTTRRNNVALGVANRDRWTVTAVNTGATTTDATTTGAANSGASITVTGEHGVRVLPSGYVRAHVQLAYASTVHGAQGDTSTAAHVVIGEHTSAAAAYVAMTRGREDNVAHLVADNLEHAREQWSAVFRRDRADLGPAHAAHLATHLAAPDAAQDVARDVARDVPPRPIEVVLDQLRHAWTVEADTQTRLERACERRDMLRDIVAIRQRRDTRMPDRERRYEDARAAAERSAAALRQVESVVTAEASDLAGTLTAEWDRQRQQAREAAHTVQRGAGRLGQRRAAVREARDYLSQWSATWAPTVPGMPTRIEQVVSFATWFDDAPRHHAHLAAAARAAVEQAHPGLEPARQAVQDTDAERTSARRELREAEGRYSAALSYYGNLGYVSDPASRLADLEPVISADESTVAETRDRIAALRAEPAVRDQPAGVLDEARTDWKADRTRQAAQLASRAAIESSRQHAAARHHRAAAVPHHPAPDRGPSIGR